MNEDIIYDLKWQYFTSNVTSRLSEVFTENSFCDVTLVSDDQKPFQAHRYVLSTFSPVLKNILLNNPHSHPLIYLRGVNQKDLDSILQFIYLGLALVKHKDIKRFYQTAKDLQIKNLAENIRKGNPPESVDDLENIDNKPKEDIHKDDENQTENEYAGNINLDIADEIINIDDNEFGSGKQLYKCGECEKSYKRKDFLKSHQESVHEGVRYFCDQCGYSYHYQSDLKKHKKSVHEGLRYSCNRCDYQAKQQNHLKAHKESAHEGVRYFCDQCEYNATTRCQIKKHKISFHEGIRFYCDQCNYEATKRCNLKRHKKSVHRGLKVSK